MPRRAAKRGLKTKTERFTFSKQVEDRPAVHCAFEILYWCGLYLEELFAITGDDIDFAGAPS